ncbi:MAG: hypothetical protein Kow0037_23980 [Calditrichia bacterium]
MEINYEEFINILDHEFRTPITIISTAYETLSIFLKDSEKAEINDILSEGHTALEHLKRKLDLMRILVKLNGPSISEFTETDLKGIIITVAARIKPLLLERRIEMGFRIKEDLFSSGVEEYLYLLFEQLLSNAVRYTPAGGKVSISATRAGNLNVVTISDTGTGLPENSTDRIFDPFAIGYAWENHQSDEGDPNGGSLGLGLYLCKRIVELHGGKIWAESAGENKGSKFFVALPALD